MPSAAKFFRRTSNRLFHRSSSSSSSKENTVDTTKGRAVRTPRRRYAVDDKPPEPNRGDVRPPAATPVVRPEEPKAEQRMPELELEVAKEPEQSAVEPEMEPVPEAAPEAQDDSVDAAPAPAPEVEEATPDAEMQTEPSVSPAVEDSVELEMEPAPAPAVEEGTPDAEMQTEPSVSPAVKDSVEPDPFSDPSEMAVEIENKSGDLTPPISIPTPDTPDTAATTPDDTAATTAADADPVVTDPTPATSEEEADADLGGPICHICQEPTGITRFKEGTAPAKPEQLAVLPCGHQFGHICILEWLDHGVGQSCPLCRSLHQHSKCGHYAMPALASKDLPVLKKGERMPPVCQICRVGADPGHRMLRLQWRIKEARGLAMVSMSQVPAEWSYGMVQREWVRLSEEARRVETEAEWAEELQKSWLEAQEERRGW